MGDTSDPVKAAFPRCGAKALAARSQVLRGSRRGLIIISNDVYRLDIGIVPDENRRLDSGRFRTHTGWRPPSRGRWPPPCIETRGTRAGVTC